MLTATGHVLHEATACAVYLMERGVGAGKVLKEVRGQGWVVGLSLGVRGGGGERLCGGRLQSAGRRGELRGP